VRAMRGVILSLSLVAAPMAASASGVLGQPGIPSNCDPNRPAAAFLAGTQTNVVPSRPAPIPCGSSTGYPAVESRIAASTFGIVYNPATNGSTTGVASSQDQGVTWTASGSNGGIDDNLFVDQDTGRIFWVVFNGDPANPTNHEVAFSDDGGRHWATSATGACCFDGENSRLVTARPVTGLAQPTGYPNVVYLCSDSSLLGGVEYAAGARVCSRSLDGGATFGSPTPLFSKPVPQHPECAPYGGEYFAASEGAYPEAGPGGTLYTLVHCGTDHVAVTYLGYSTDEAATWHLLAASACTAGATGPEAIPDAQELRVDGNGNLYAAWTRTTQTNTVVLYDDAPVLQVSRDGGCSWSAPVRVVPPGVVAHSHHPELDAFGTGQPAPYWPQPFTDYSWFMDVKEPGHVAFNFYGTTDPTGAHFDAYVSETRDGLDPNPMFWAAAVNAPTMNMRDGAYADEDSSGNEHVGLSIGADGSPWGSFTDGTMGFAGRLYWHTG
jgi:hypothetical protein